MLTHQPSQQTRRHHYRGIARIGATGNGCNDDGAIF